MPIKQTSNSEVFKISKPVGRAFNQLKFIVDTFDNTTRNPMIEVSNNLIQPTNDSVLTIGKIFFGF
jgi:hypothetical protein